MDPGPPEDRAMGTDVQATDEKPNSVTPADQGRISPIETLVQDQPHTVSETTEDPEDDEEYSDEGSETRVSTVTPRLEIALDVTEFEVPLPPELQPSPTDETFSKLEELPDMASHVPASPPQTVHVSAMLKPLDSGDSGPSFEGVEIVHVGRESGLLGNLQATYLRLPPGTRSSRPFAQRLGDSITYCISGRGILWQNGWTFPFGASDCAGWKGGTGIAHTIINDSNSDGSPGEDLVLITAYEIREGEAVFYPLDHDIEDSNLESEGKILWKDPPVQGEFGSHPAVPSVSAERANKTIPEPQLAYRPSNVINAIAELDTIGEGELFANATSLSQETGLSTGFGCNLEVPPPGTRSSDPHAHSIEDELVYVVSGAGLVWINGHVQPVHEGDAIGFVGGTGMAHNFINDSNADGAEGDPLILWIIGQNRVTEGDLVFYPLHVEEKSKSRRWWADSPKHELGTHNGRPQRPFKLS